MNFPLSLMSAWMVGKVEAPAYANIIEEKAEQLLELIILLVNCPNIEKPWKDPSTVGLGKVLGWM